MLGKRTRAVRERAGFEMLWRAAGVGWGRRMNLLTLSQVSEHERKAVIGKAVTNSCRQPAKLEYQNPPNYITEIVL